MPQLNAAPDGPMLDYELVDVFTALPFFGNPLAVVFDADERLGSWQMQRIAAEFNLSETAFVLPASAPGADYRVRIFTPGTELPFAGHPSVGTAWVLARRGELGLGSRVQQCGAGLLPIVVDERGALLGGADPAVGDRRSSVALSAAVGLSEAEVDNRFPCMVAGAGLDFPVLAVDRASLGRAVPDPGRLAAAASSDTPSGGVLLVAIEGTASDPPLRVHARMFGVGIGVVEDPATGSATLALGAYLAEAGVAVPGACTHYHVRQGEQMGRASDLYGEVDVDAAGRATAVRVRGDVVPVGSGRIAAPQESPSG